jgi:Leucine-rich repeat (LRR) protein
VPPLPYFLTSVKLDANQLTGALPEDVFDLASLVELRLNDNKMTGPVWGSINRLSLTTLALADNDFCVDVLADAGGSGDTTAAVVAMCDAAAPCPVTTPCGKCGEYECGGGVPTPSAPHLMCYSASGSKECTDDRCCGNTAVDWLHWAGMIDAYQFGAYPNAPATLTAYGMVATNVTFVNQGITGTLDDFAMLTELTTLDVHGNMLAGGIPATIGWGKLTKLDLSDNALTGSIPSPVNWTPATQAMTSLSVANNMLTSAIPGALATLINLQSIDLSFNQLTGTILASFDTLNQLQTLRLNDNKLSGLVPPLTTPPLSGVLALRNNADTAGVNTLCYDMFSNSTIVKCNPVACPVPAPCTTCADTTCMTGNEVYRLSPSMIACPTTVCSQSLCCGNSIMMHLQDRALVDCSSRAESSCTATASGLAVRELDLESLDLTGSVPSELSRLTAVEKLLFTANKLTGTVPTDIFVGASALPLHTVDLSFNELTGSTTSIFANTTVALNDNMFSGGVADYPTLLAPVVSSSPLQEILLHNNALTGSLPKTLLQFPALSELRIDGADMRVTGELPLGPSAGLPNLDMNLSGAGNVFCHDMAVGSAARYTALFNSCTPSCTTPLIACGICANHTCAATNMVPKYELIPTGCLADECTDAECCTDDGVAAFINEGWIDTDGAITAAGSAATTINFSNKNYTNELPSALASMSSLVALHLGGNRFSGALPSLDAMRLSLERFDVGNNMFSGGFFPLGRASSPLQFPLLKYVFAANNKLTGELPGGLADKSLFPAIGRFDINVRLENNDFCLGSASAPINTGGAYTQSCAQCGAFTCPSPQRAKVGQANLECVSPVCLPTDCCDRTTLAALLESGSVQCTGTDDASCLPTTAGQTQTTLTIENLIATTVPTVIGQMYGLTSLKLSGGLTGTIPSFLGRLGGLKVLDLSDNELSGSIPRQIFTMAGLEEVRLSGNKLEGTIPAIVFTRPALKELKLDGNSLTGNFTEAVASLKDLVSLDLSNNQLIGSIPRALNSLAQLTTLRLDGNTFCWSPNTYVGSQKCSEPCPHTSDCSGFAFADFTPPQPCDEQCDTSSALKNGTFNSVQCSRLTTEFLCSERLCNNRIRECQCTWNNSTMACRAWDRFDTCVAVTSPNQAHVSDVTCLVPDSAANAAAPSLSLVAALATALACAFATNKW